MAMISSDTKIHAVKQYYVGSGSLNEIAAKFGVHHSTLQKRLLNYELFGGKGLCHRAGNHHYPAIVKQQAAGSYLSGQMSIEEVCKKYQLRSRLQLEQWVREVFIRNHAKPHENTHFICSHPMGTVTFEKNNRHEKALSTNAMG